MLLLIAARIYSFNTTYNTTYIYIHKLYSLMFSAVYVWWNRRNRYLRPQLLWRILRVQRMATAFTSRLGDAEPSCFAVGLTCACVCEHPISGVGWVPSCTGVWAWSPRWVASRKDPETVFKRPWPKLFAKRPNKTKIFSKIKTIIMLHP